MKHLFNKSLNILAGEKGKIIISLLILIIRLTAASSLSAQYFGRNKPGYKIIDYNVLQTPHFDIYHYLKDDSMLTTISLWAEKWYQIHQKIFKDTFKLKNPVILYNTHADFQQTNTVSSLVSVGTGGVTESLKNRVIMPVAPTLAQTDHTLGHEIVHAFQYHMFLKSDTSKNLSLRNLPLWMTEGMAEYLSLGSVDPNTSMWMRDALLNDDFPTLNQLSKESKYFPYRYGQAFWAMVGKTWGDTIIIPLYKQTAKIGLKKAIDTVLGIDRKTLSGMWKSAMWLHFGKYLNKSTDSLAGERLISNANGGRMNISPSISPDGKYIAFFSEKNVFTLDLFLADAVSGRITKKLSSVVKNNEIDDFNFIESSGTWSPDGKYFAFVIFSKGKNKLAVLDIDKAQITKEIEIEGVPSFYNPAWSPDGKAIVLSGLVDGASDLYLYYLESEVVKRLTNNYTADIHPAWSSDGKQIAFAEESIIKTANTQIFWFNLATIDLNTGKVTRLNVLKGANNVNPCFSVDDKSIFFLSDADGFRNLYRFDLNSENTFRLTDYMTGISGITPYSPAICLAKDKNLIAYTYYFNNSYQIWIAGESEFQSSRAGKSILNTDAATLPPVRHYAGNIVDTTLYYRNNILSTTVDSLEEVPFKSRFRLDYISNQANIGVSTGMFRSNMGGSINMIFSDITGNNKLYSALSLNGEVYDFGGMVSYINQKGRIKWGVSVSHIPYRAGTMFLTTDSMEYEGKYLQVNNLILDYTRMFEENISGFASYPVSRTRRFEASFSSSWYHYRIDRINNYYLLNGVYIGAKREKLPAPEGNNYQQCSLAFVEDKSFFGMTSPLQGSRARYQIDKYFGAVNFFTAMVDYRNYFYLRPVSFAFRLYHYGRYGSGSETSAVSPLYLAYPWLIRGYEKISFYENSSQKDNFFNVSQLSGSKILIANAEIRFPLTGSQRLALIKSKWLFSDLNLFFDSGLAWSSGNTVQFDWNSSSADNDIRFPVYSTGASLRINLLGYLVVEPYYAFPLQNGGFRNGLFGVNFLPGW